MTGFILYDMPHKAVLYLSTSGELKACLWQTMKVRGEIVRDGGGVCV